MVCGGRHFVVREDGQLAEARQQLQQFRKCHPRGRSVNRQLFSVLGNAATWLGQVFDQLPDAQGADTDLAVQLGAAYREPRTADKAGSGPECSETTILASMEGNILAKAF